MGCGNSKDVAERIEKQDKKIDELIKMNAGLENNCKDLLNTIKNQRGSESADDISNLKSMIDTRFNNLESHVRRIHNDFRLKLFDGIEESLRKDGLGRERENNPQKNANKNDASLSLPSIHDADKEKGDERDAHWKDILETSPQNRPSHQLIGVKRNSLGVKGKNERLDSQDSFKENSGAKLARVQDKDYYQRESSGAKLAQVQDNMPQSKGTQDVHERLGEGEQLAKGHFLMTGTTKSVRKYQELSSSQFKQQHMESMKSKELNNEVLNHNEIKMEMGELGETGLKSAAETGQSKKSMQANAVDLIPEKGKEIYNDVMAKMFKNSPKIQ